MGRRRRRTKALANLFLLLWHFLAFHIIIIIIFKLLFGPAEEQGEGIRPRIVIQCPVIQILSLPPPLPTPPPSYICRFVYPAEVISSTPSSLLLLWYIFLCTQIRTCQVRIVLDSRMESLKYRVSHIIIGDTFVFSFI